MVQVSVCSARWRGQDWQRETRCCLRPERRRSTRVPGDRRRLDGSPSHLRLSVESGVRLGVPLHVPLPRTPRRVQSIDPDGSARIWALRPVEGSPHPRGDAPGSRGRARCGRIREGHALRPVGRVRDRRPLRGDLSGQGVLPRAVQFIAGRDGQERLPVGMGRGTVGWMAREHPRGLGDACVGRPQRPLDGTKHARRPERARTSSNDGSRTRACPPALRRRRR